MVTNVTDAAKNLVGGATGTANHGTVTSHDTDTRRITGTYDTDTPRVTSSYDMDTPRVTSSYDMDTPRVISSYDMDTPRVISSYDTSATTQPAQGVGAGLWETIKENPIPTALAAASLGWLFAHRSKSAAASRNSNAPYQQQSFQGQDMARSSGDTLQDKAGQAANQVGNTVGDAADTLQDKAGQAAGTVGSAVGQVGSAVGGAVGQMGSTVGSTIGQVGSTVGSTVGQVGGAVGSAAGQAGSTVGSTVGGLAEGTQQQAQRAQNQFQKVLHENPLAVGAAGLALGAAIGLVIPETQRENQMLGGARDTVMDNAVGTAQDTMQKVGTIAQKAESAAESAVKEEAHTQGLVGSAS